MNIIFTPFSWLLLQFYYLTNNFGAAVILFAIAANLVMLPLHFKGKKSMMRVSRIQPKIVEIQKTYANDKMKQNELIQKLYETENINPMGGCGWSLLPFPIFLILYAVMRQPLTYLMGLSSDQITQIANILNYEITSTNGYYEIEMAQMIHENFAALSSQVSGLMDINFMFFGINLSEIPDWRVWENPQWAFAIPILSGAAAYLQQWIITKTNPTSAASNAGRGTGAMMKLMPLMSVWFAFIMPATMGVYWIINSLISLAREYFLNKYYSKKFEEEDALRAAAEKRRKEKEREERAAKIAMQQEIAAQQRAALGRPKGKKKKNGSKKPGVAQLNAPSEESDEEIETVEAEIVENGETEQAEEEPTTQTSDKNWKF